MVLGGNRELVMPAISMLQVSPFVRPTRSRYCPMRYPVVTNRMAVSGKGLSSARTHRYSGMRTFDPRP
eukprot:3147418-Rhodomonas_salina.1